MGGGKILGMEGKTEPIIISLGGSLIVPPEGIDTEFLKKFNKFIRSKIADGHRRFFIICGGGRTSRIYRDAAKEVIGKVPEEDLDWLGIHPTRLNAALLRTIFKDVAYFRVIKHYDQFDPVDKPVAIMSGWKPGWSTDYCAVVAAEKYGAKIVLNLSNVDMVYDSDPKLNPKAKPFSKISWADYRKICGDKWEPGANWPFDPIASKRAHELGIKVYILNGRNLENVDRALEGKDFVGTVIS